MVLLPLPLPQLLGHIESFSVQGGYVAYPPALLGMRVVDIAGIVAPPTGRPIGEEEEGDRKDESAEEEEGSPPPSDEDDRRLSTCFGGPPPEPRPLLLPPPTPPPPIESGVPVPLTGWMAPPGRIRSLRSLVLTVRVAADESFRLIASTSSRPRAARSTSVRGSLRPH